MSVSANTLFHFTDDKEKLKSILKNSFYPKYSLEELRNVTSELSSFRVSHIPMVCFCDLLFPQIKSHIDFYGDYGIGLRKSPWGVQKGISPIFYFPEKSISAKLLRSISTEISSSIDAKSQRIAMRKKLQNFYTYVKPYQGIAFNRKEKNMVDRIFYDEREWRFVPPNFAVLPEKKAPPALLDRENEKMKTHHKLTFNAKDVKYIIVKKEVEIPEFVTYIEHELKTVFKSDEIKQLLTKLISSEQINEDM